MITVALMNPAFGDSRKATVAATSSGLPMRPSGVNSVAESRIVALISDEDEQEAMRSVVELAEAARWLSEICGTRAAGDTLFDSFVLPEMEALVALWSSALKIVDEVGARRERVPRAGVGSCPRCYSAVSSLARRRRRRGRAVACGWSVSSSVFVEVSVPESDAGCGASVGPGMELSTSIS